MAPDEEPVRGPPTETTRRETQPVVARDSRRVADSRVRFFMGPVPFAARDSGFKQAATQADGRPLSGFDGALAFPSALRDGRHHTHTPPPTCG